MNDPLTQILSRMQEYQRLNSLPLTSNAKGCRRLLDFLNCLPGDSSLREELLPYAKKSFLRRIAAKLPTLFAKAFVCLLISLMVISYFSQ